MEKCLKVVSEETISFCFVLFFACNFFKKKIYLLFKKQKKRFLFFSLDKNYDLKLFLPTFMNSSYHNSCPYSTMMCFCTSLNVNEGDYFSSNHPDVGSC